MAAELIPVNALRAIARNRRWVCRLPIGQLYPIHPKAESILGEKAYPDLHAVPKDAGIEIVDIFRRPDAVGPHVDEAIAVGAKVVWFQEGIINNEAAAKAEDAGLTVVQNRCMLKEHRRL